MTKSFKEFLDEAAVKKWTEKSVDVNNAIELLNKHCRDGLRAIDNDSLIWRGFAGSKLGKFAIVDSSTGHRTSKDTSNLYQVMMDESSALKDYPSRSKSFICGTNRSVASNYADDSMTDVYAFVPYDGTKVAVASAHDMFGIDIKTPYTREFHGVDTLNAYFGNWAQQVLKVKPTGGGQWTSLDPINAALAKMSDEKFKDALLRATWLQRNDKNIEAFFKIVNVDPNKRMTAIASTVLTPPALKLKLQTFGEALPKGKEAWFSGKAVAVRRDIMENIISVITQEKKAGIREAVNDKIFYTDFKKEKDILDGEYKLIASAGYVGYGAKPGFKSNQFRIVAKTAKGAEVGWVNFEKHGDHLEALDLSVQPAHRRKGIASEMYKLAKECGNSVAPSKLQTGMGKTFWNKDHSK